jgi:hypothetical protein
MSLGIDKISIYTSEFKVLKGHSLTIQPMPYTPSKEDKREDPILWKGQKGAKAYLNMPYYNLSINEKGASISFNPSKMLHPYNLTNDTHQVLELSDNIIDDLEANGVLLPPKKELRVSRFDMAKNVQMNLPIQFYSPLFKSMRGKRMSNKEYPSSYYFANKSRELNFYDKTEEVSSRTTSGQPPIIVPERLMRGELRAKKGITVGSIYRVNDLESILKVGDQYREERFKSTLKNQIFANGNQKEQLQIFAVDYDKELRHLKAYKERYKRGSIDKYLSDKGVESLIDDFGNLDNFRNMLLEAGYQREYTYRIIREIEERIQYASFFQTENQKENISKLYNEVYTKFAI